jgi:hypothetical protein
MVHNIIFEDGLKAKELETTVLELCDCAEEIGTAFGCRDYDPKKLRSDLMETYFEYNGLMAKYEEEIPHNLQTRYQEALKFVKQ